ncbi:KIF17 [Mytilus edulis]|uniref:KIF17 n=1 Tax=Mytilus edulis TaxID=6550 RepID=A0A8S3V1K4_MYTED|nr:KIF17 [Mytilus edulis]
MSTDTWIDVLKHAKYRKLKKNKFLKNTIGCTDRLYIVLTGGLSVFLAMQQSVHVLPPIDGKDSQIRNIRQFGFKVDSFGPGKVVEESYRLENVHMITDVDTDLMVISKILYERTMQSQMEKDSDTKELFIKTHPFFSTWTEDQQNNLRMALVKKTYRNNQKIMIQGEPFSGLFFITKGRARLSAQPRNHPRQFEHVFEGKDMDKELLEIIKIHIPKRVDTMVSRGDTQGSHMDEQTYVRRLEGYIAAEKREFQKVVDICIVSAGEIFGDLELLLDLKADIFSVTAMSEGCEAFVLQEQDISRFLSKRRVPFTFKLMKFLSETKLTGRMSSTQGQKVPIFPRLLYRLRQLRIEVPKQKLTIANNISEKKKISKEDHHLSVEKLDECLLAKSFLKDKGPFLKPLVPGTVYFKEIMRKRIAKRTGYQGNMSQFNKKFQTEEPKDPSKEYVTTNKRLKDSIVKSVREGIRTEKVIKRLSLSWNKNTLMKH